MRAVEKYYAEAGDAQSQNLDAIRDKVQADPERYVLETAILSEEDRPDMGQYTVTVRATLNVSQLNNAVKAGSAVAQNGGGQKSKLTFIFVSRQTDTAQSFANREYATAEIKEQGRATRSSAQYRASVETGGSTTRLSRRVSGCMVVSFSCSGFISPRPLKRPMLQLPSRTCSLRSRSSMLSSSASSSA